MVDVYMSWLVSETLYLLGHWASSRTSNMVRLFERQPVSCAQCLVSREPNAPLTPMEIDILLTFFFKKKRRRHNSWVLQLSKIRTLFPVIKVAVTCRSYI